MNEGGTHGALMMAGVPRPIITGPAQVPLGPWIMAPSILGVGYFEIFI